MYFEWSVDVVCPQILDAYLMPISNLYFLIPERFSGYDFLVSLYKFRIIAGKNSD